jgi:hypothetical protein
VLGLPIPAGATPTPATGAGPQRSVSFEFRADRNQLYTAWNALANLADQAGKVTISVAATNENGFDQSKLQNKKPRLHGALAAVAFTIVLS